MANLTLMIGNSLQLRSMLYLVAPSESMYNKIEEVPDYELQMFPWFIGFIVLEAAISTIIDKDNAFRINDTISSLTASIISRLPVLLIGGLELKAYIWFHDNYSVIQLPWNSVWTWVLCLLGVDVGYYWAHRYGHEINLFWTAHQVHHSSEEFNLTTGLRHSIMQQYFTWIFYLPLALLVPPPIFLVHIQLNCIFQFWVHTEIIETIGPLEYVLNSPRHHRVHHACNPQYINKNYAGIFIIWDRMFGTFEPEVEEKVYGLTTPILTWDPLWIQFGHLLQAIWKFYKMKTIGNKLRSLFFGPGWAIDKPRLGDFSKIPKVNRKTFIKYDPPVPRWCKYYCFVHFTVILIEHQVASAYKTDITTAEALAVLFWILTSTHSLCALLSNRHYASFLEGIRCISYMAINSSNYYVLAIPIPDTIRKTIEVLFLVSSCLWITRAIRMNFKTKTL